MVRGLAAVAVCVGHARAFLFVDYAQSGRGALATIFYVLTGFQHQAVMVFFALSGFLVGGSVLRAHATGRWRWADYLSRRLCRLWIVIVPALLLTLMWDSIGMAIRPAGYGAIWFDQLLSVPVDLSWSVATFVGNLFFLQRITVGTFGSNGPLWSLANEFWYYILFPLIMASAIGGEARWQRVASAVVALVLAVLLPTQMLKLGLTWLAGVAAYLVVDRKPFRGRLARPAAGMAATLALVGALSLSVIAHWWGSDYLIAFAFAGTLPWLAGAAPASSLYRRVGFFLADISYTLYLVHFPLLAFGYFMLLGPAQFTFTPIAVLILAVVMAAILVYAWAIWWLFERNTERMRLFIARLAKRGQTASSMRDASPSS